MDKDSFSVIQHFEDDSHEYVKRNVSPEEAVDAFAIYSTCAGAQIGSTRRVTIMVGGCVRFEWQYGKGLRKAVLQA
jgi:hypothetical protein